MRWAERFDGLVAGVPQVGAGPARPQFVPDLKGGVLAAGLIAACLVLEWASFLHEYKGVPITPWNPALGLVFAAMVLLGARYAVALFIGTVIAEFTILRTNVAWPVSIGIAAIMAAGYGVTAWQAREYLRQNVGLNTMRDIAVLLVSGAAGAVLVALFISLLLLAEENLDLADVLVAAGPLLIGDMIGIAVITPLVLRLATHADQLRQLLSARLAGEFLLFVAVVIAILWGILVVAGGQGAKLFYLLFFPVVIAAVRHGVDGACVALAVTQLGLLGLLHGRGGDVTAFTEFQLLMLVLSATGLTVGVVVTERREADHRVRQVERQLRANEAEAARASRFNLVSGTTAALAHEINQPMTAARALARSVQQILRQPAADMDRAHANLANLIAQVDHAAGVVRHMRDFLRRGAPHSSTIVLRELVANAVALVREDVAEKGISLAVDVADDLPTIIGDQIQLQEVILNLVRNSAEAIASSHGPDGRIVFTARRAGVPEQIEIAVADNGPGIAADVAERLFDPLTTSKPEGLGLGLSISAAIIEAHGGRLWLHAGKPGATEFRFSLPLGS